MPDPSPLTMRQLVLGDVHATAAVLAAALDDDPAYQFLFPDARRRREGLADLFARNLQTHLPYRCTSVAVDGGRVVGTVTLRPPEGFAISLWTMVRQGLIPFALAHGRLAVRRLFALKKTYDDLEARLARGDRHWLVHMMAVDPDRQGRGVGSRLLEHVLARTTDEATSAAPSVLTTHRERNVVFYERAGFVVDGVQRISMSSETPYRVWGMRRLPRLVTPTSHPCP
jgi:GNAT superfamily N-acetyltransferase